MPDPGKTYLRAREGFVMADDTIVRGGQIVAADDRVVAGRESLFAPLDDDPAIEQATRAPGEIRITPTRDRSAVVAKSAKATKTGKAKNKGKAATDG